MKRKMKGQRRRRRRGKRRRRRWCWWYLWILVASAWVGPWKALSPLFHRLAWEFIGSIDFMGYLVPISPVPVPDAINSPKWSDFGFHYLETNLKRMFWRATTNSTKKSFRPAYSAVESKSLDTIIVADFISHRIFFHTWKNSDDFKSNLSGGQ